MLRSGNVPHQNVELVNPGDNAGLNIISLDKNNMPSQNGDIFLPTHNTPNSGIGKVFTVEMHHQVGESAESGDNVGLNIKGLDKNNMLRTGD
eukprot:11194219-Karenia_brevis.AAC.1